jgi:hypothetical protein
MNTEKVRNSRWFWWVALFLCFGAMAAIDATQVLFSDTVVTILSFLVIPPLGWTTGVALHKIRYRRRGQNRLTSRLTEENL